MHNQNSVTFLASCIGAGFSIAVTAQRKLQLQQSHGWLERDLLFWTADSIAGASAYAETLHSIYCARIAVGYPVNNNAPFGLIVASRFGRWYGERLIFDHAPPDQGRCQAMIDTQVSYYYDSVCGGEIREPARPTVMYRLACLKEGYVVYRHWSDLTCPIEQHAKAHRVATFVCEAEGQDYCEYRNEMMVKYGTDDVMVIGAGRAREA